MRNIYVLRHAARASTVVFVACAFGCTRHGGEALRCIPAAEMPAALSGCGAPALHGIAVPGFHGGSARLGWNDAEPDLTPARVGGGNFGLVWSSAPFDACSGRPGRMYASPLYADDVRIQGGPYGGMSFSVVFAATSNGTVYALNAFAAPCDGGAIAAGTMLWKTQLVTPSIVENLDGGIALGILSTPALDTSASVLYLTAMDRPGGAPPVWKVFALDITNGATLAGWPLVLNAAALESVNTNGPQRWETDATQLSQRSALALSPAGDRLYISFGGYGDTVTGWMVAVDTARATVAASFSSAHGAALGEANGGLWGAGGATVDSDGTVFMTSGNAPSGSAGIPGVWGDSLLAWGPALALRGTYSPWNGCLSDAHDADIGGDSPLLLPDQSSSGTSTPRLIAFGSKQGAVYLLQRDALPGGVVARPACGVTNVLDAEHDSSLLPPGAPYCDPRDPTHCVRGPLSVFGPYSDAPMANEDDRAKMRSTPAYFADSGGMAYLFVSGTTKAADDVTSVPPSLARVGVHLAAGQPAYLVVDAADKELSFLNPGSPVVTSVAGQGPVVWIVDENAVRTAPLASSSPRPILYAVDGTTMSVLFRSGPSDLTTGGKYVTPVIAHGTVFVGTDRLQAFGVRP